jgi:hypothetical protein
MFVTILRTAMGKRNLEVLLTALEMANRLPFEPHIVEVARRFAKQLVRLGCAALAC